MPRRTPRFSASPQLALPTVAQPAHYGSAWRKLRLLVLNGEPLCRVCASQGLVTPATEVDHITPRALGGQDDFLNCQPICRLHHVEKTARDIQRINRGW